MPRAAVCSAVGAPLVVEELDLEPPRVAEVRVRLGAAGICGSDLSVQHGHLPSPMPVVLGHEGAGVVTAIGTAVDGLEPGDRVAVCAMPQCGACPACRRGRPALCEPGASVLMTGGLLDGTPRLRRGDGAVVHQMVATGTFAEEVVVPAASVVPLPDDMPFAPAALLGCAAVTGAGAALNTADITDGDTVVVLGCGVVGLTALQGARIAGADRLVAVDLLPTKLTLAREFGATDLVAAGDGDPVAAVLDLTGGRGADVVIEAIGLQATVDQAIAMTARGGEVVFVGAGSKDVRVNVRQFSGLVSAAKTFKGCLYGEADLRRDIPRLVDHYRSGALALDRLVSRAYALDDLNDGFAALGGGAVVGAVVRF